ncbi:MAG: hypothetical protein AB7U82_07450 [Blastocatellales bacterium]
MQYLFVFGFCTPQQWLNNERQGWDDEDSYAFFVEAANAEDAMHWGRQVVDSYVRFLFEEAKWPEPLPSWRNANFACWIEEHPLDRFSGLAIETLPVISVGEIPSFDDWPKATGFGQINDVDT